MQTIQDWIDWYYSMGVFTCPNNYSFNLKDWSSLEKAEKTFHSLDWSKADGLKAVAGVKGIRVLILNGLRDKDAVHRQLLLANVLALLKLSDDYPWIIEREETLYIVVDIWKVNTKKDIVFKSGLFQIERPFIVPAINSEAYFYQNRKPSKHPQWIAYEDLLKCIEWLKEGKGGTIVFPPEGGDSTPEPPKEPWWKTVLSYAIHVIILLLLFMLVGALPLVGIPAIIVFFWINWDKIFKKKK